MILVGKVKTKKEDMNLGQICIWGKFWVELEGEMSGSYDHNTLYSCKTCSMNKYIYKNKPIKVKSYSRCF